MKLLHVVGARPNFIKVAPVISACADVAGMRQLLVHTGQHYDAAMSQVFFDQLGIPQPDYDLGVGSGSHARQTAEIMVRFEELASQERPDWVVVYGDVNSTLAAAVVSAKLGIPVAHVEAGLRSFDRTMPEEINRVLVDQVSELLLTSSPEAERNLLREGIAADKIHFVGNVMIDTLLRLLPLIREQPILRALGLQRKRFALATLHRPSNVDQPESLERVLDALAKTAAKLPVVFPVHPRTRSRIESLSFRVPERLLLREPLGYLEFLALQDAAALVITDSGGVQEETTVLGVPCLTLRSNTERPVTVEIGTNRLLGNDMELLHREVDRILAGDFGTHAIPPRWDGRAGERIAQLLALRAPLHVSGRT